MENWVCTYKKCKENANYQWWNEDNIIGYSCEKHSKLVCEIYRKKWNRDKAGIVTETEIYKKMVKDLGKGLI